MFEISCSYNGKIQKFQIQKTEKMKDILERIRRKLDQPNIFMLFNGGKVQENISFEELVKNKDKLDEIIFILQTTDLNAKKINFISSKDIICPECKESALIHFNNYTINIYNCKNNHTKNLK